MPSSKAKKNDAIFLLACRTGNTDTLEQLINARKFDVNRIFRNLNGDQAPLWAKAIERGSLPVLKLLLNSGAEVKLHEYFHYLESAINSHYSEIVKILLELGVKLNVTTEDDYVSCFEVAQCDLIWRTPRMRNKELQDRYYLEIVQIMEIILEHCYQLSHRVEEKPVKSRKLFKLCRAIFHDEVNRVLEILKDHDLSYFDILSKRYYHPPLLAMELKRFEIAKLFIEQRVYLQEIFFKSIEMQNQNLMELCIEKGMDPRARDAIGQDALTLACRFNNVDGFILLVEKYGLNPSDVNYLHRPPLFSATEYRFIKIILDRFSEIDINQLDGSGYTLLSIDLSCEIFAMHLEYGANPNICSKYGVYPYHLCVNDSGRCKINAYIGKLRIINPEYADDLILKIIRSYDMRNWQELTIEEKFDCEAELEQFKRIQISRAFMDQSSQSLFHFIFFAPNKLARYSRNEIMLKLYQDCDNNFENIYKNYGFILNYNLRRGQKRANLMKSARETLHSAFGSEVPEEITDFIFEYLSDEKIERLDQGPE